MAVICLSSATMMYLVESRSNIPSIYHAMWLAIVTMTTVGYGDYFPTSLAPSRSRTEGEKQVKMHEDLLKTALFEPFRAIKAHFGRHLLENIRNKRLRTSKCSLRVVTSSPPYSPLSPCSSWPCRSASSDTSSRTHGSSGRRPFFSIFVHLDGFGCFSGLF